ncbi:2OG-Fe(II) oxygenase [Streptomyces sp. AC512_CC834]|uniref:2OG-Fe(II) oxygenase n=1 Tax=Streptomyces sp. AC512_CC834 TaxID=2823691 RepID=UPI001C252A57|nr:2OG-Fe(II) oxygenase [Streptomyces sp. AC512_CC834]
MRELRVMNNVVANHAQIVALAERHRALFADYPARRTPSERLADREPFDPYRDSEYEDDDQYHVLQADRMPQELHAAILAGILPPGTVPPDLYVQINRYDPGDYVLPHRDSLQQGLYMLTTSDTDALVAQDADGRAVRVVDRAGRYITHDPKAWHWVDPVTSAARYTLVTIPALSYPEHSQP